MARRIIKIARDIAIIALAIAAMWYVLKIFTFSSLSEEDAKFWLGVSNRILLGSVVVVVVGLLGELSDDEKWKKTVWYPTAKWVVIVGILFEFAADAGVFQAGDRVTELQDKKISELETPRTLSGAQKDRMAKVAELYRLPFKLVSNPEAESWHFALDIGATLKENGWTWLPCVNADNTRLQTADDRPSECTSLLDHIEVDAPPALLPVANALSDAIREPNIFGMERVWPDEKKRPPIVTIYVGSKR